MILRVAKKSAHGEPDHHDNRPEVYHRVLKDVMKEHFGEFVQSGRVVSVDSHFAGQLASIAAPFRPQIRSENSTIDLQSTTALLMADATTVPGPWNQEDVIGIEIKPKCGTLPLALRCDDDKDEHRWLRSVVCKYCMVQHHKSGVTGVTSEISNYCPLELFSGDQARMRKVLLRLLKRPQNNLRIFRGGKMVAPTVKEGAATLSCPDCTDDVTDALKDCFGNLEPHQADTEKKEEHNDVGEEDTSSTCHCLMDLVTKTLLAATTEKGTVLECLLKVHRLDEWGLENMHKLPKKQDPDITPFVGGATTTTTNNNNTKNSSTTHNPTTASSSLLSSQPPLMAPSSLWVSSPHCMAVQHTNQTEKDKLYQIYKKRRAKEEEELLLLQQQQQQQNTEEMNGSQDCWSQALPSELDEVMLARFILAQTCKDCSLMLSLVKCNHVDDGSTAAPGSCFVKALDGNTWKCEISVLDLQLKALSRIPVWAQNDSKVLQHYTKAVLKWN
eukprot:TRINITY_DN66159_c12_g1_i1.p1 TRINITY_DN66159_c12_g1~~TRINITY_DN66159_c12_g1_i1.p1  ORF type:complete len:546 (+),score=96.61 TRINITY_DN66159_c12_g1_i1:144-1640(+)